MSLPAIAKQLEAKGRHGDTMLVHMSPNEVKGLHAIAKAHGKEITINPETGLPEAFSLKKFLPTIIGAGLTIASGGALSPLMAAGITGAGYSVATGSLQKGLMAGLGAYGGAGLAGGLAGIGAAAPVSATQGAAANAVGGANAGNVAALNPSNVMAVNPTTGVNAAFTGGSSGITNGLTANQANLLGYSTPTVSNAASQVSQAAANTAAPSWTQAAGAQWDKVASGAGKLYDGGFDAISKFAGDNKMNLALAAAPVVSDALSPKPTAPLPKEKSFIRPYDYDPNATNAGANVATASNASGTPFTGSSEQLHFNPVFTAKTPYEAPGPEYAAANGGIVGMAMGGEAEREAALNSVGMNGKYPMANLDVPVYSNPAPARPMANEVVNPSGDVGVDEFTGQPRMANGGIARYFGGGIASAVAQSQGNPESSSYSYDPNTQQFTTTTTPATPKTNPFLEVPVRIMGLMLGKQLPKPEPAKPTVTTSGGIAGQTNVAPQQAPQQAAPSYALSEPVQVPAYQSPEQRLGLQNFYPAMNNALAAHAKTVGMDGMATGGIAGQSYNLGGYSDGGRLLKGPGDGVSDSIPATIGNRQPARLADGEFVVPARIVSELGNGSTEAGARKLYAMMDRVQKSRKKSIGKKKVAVNSRADKHLPA